MKISKIMAVAAATAVAASSVALTAFAAPETVTEKKDVVIANSEFAGKETITITVESETEEANYSNGCVGYNNAAGEWTAVEWTLVEATSFEVALDVDADIQAGADLQVQCWWFDKNYTVSWVVTEPETTAPETEAPAVTSETENQPGDCAGKPNQTDAPATDAPATDAPATDAPAVEYGPEAALDLANKGVSGVDSDGKARLDIINTFVTDEASNILTADALTSAKVNKLTFTFTVSDYTGTAFKAFPIFSFNNWSQAYWGPGNESNTVDVTPVDVTGNGTYTVELVLPEGVTVEDCQCLALKTDYVVDDTEGAVNPVLSLDSLVANKAADADAPATDAPATDAPATDAPTTDTPATEVPGDSNGANAPTGVGLVVVPAVVAGAVLVATGVVLKKRK